MEINCRCESGRTCGHHSLNSFCCRHLANKCIPRTRHPPLPSHCCCFFSLLFSAFHRLELGKLFDRAILLPPPPPSPPCAVSAPYAYHSRTRGALAVSPGVDSASRVRGRLRDPRARSGLRLPGRPTGRPQGHGIGLDGPNLPPRVSIDIFGE